MDAHARADRPKPLRHPSIVHRQFGTYLPNSMSCPPHTHKYSAIRGAWRRIPCTPNASLKRPSKVIQHQPETVVPSPVGNLTPKGRNPPFSKNSFVRPRASERDQGQHASPRPLGRCARSLRKFLGHALYPSCACLLPEIPKCVSGAARAYRATDDMSLLRSLRESHNTSLGPEWLHARHTPHTRLNAPRRHDMHRPQVCSTFVLMLGPRPKSASTASKADAWRRCVRKHAQVICASGAKRAWCGRQPSIACVATGRFLEFGVRPIASSAMPPADVQAHGASMLWTSASGIALEAIGQILPPRNLPVATHPTEGCQPHQTLHTSVAQTSRICPASTPPNARAPSPRAQVDSRNTANANDAHAFMLSRNTERICLRPASRRPERPAIHEHIMPT